MNRHPIDRDPTVTACAYLLITFGIIAAWGLIILLIIGAASERSTTPPKDCVGLNTWDCTAKMMGKSNG